MTGRTAGTLLIFAISLFAGALSPGASSNAPRVGVTIFRQDMDGSGHAVGVPKPILDDVCAGGQTLLISPDSKLIKFDYQANGAHGIGVVGSMGGSARYVSTSPDAVCEGLVDAFTWSADGILLYDRRTAPNAFRRLNVTTGVLTTLSEIPIADEAVQHDSYVEATQEVIVPSAGGINVTEREIHAYSVVTGADRIVARTPLAWVMAFPNGKELLYTPADAELRTMTLDGRPGDVLLESRGDTDRVRPMAISGNGNFVLYWEIKPRVAGVLPRILRVLNVKTHESWPLLNENSGIQSIAGPRWSPDGTFIAFSGSVPPILIQAASPASATPGPATPARTSAPATQRPPDPALVARARAIHERVLTLDTHDDIDVTQFTNACNYSMPLASQVTLPRMVAGGLDVVFLVVAPREVPVTSAGFETAYQQATAMFDAVHALTDAIAPGQIGLARTSDDVRKIAASGRKVAVIGVEGGAPIGTDLARVKEFYDRGARYMSLAHDAHTQLADYHGGEARSEWPNKGLSPLGRRVIAEMNKWGIMIDLSHPSRDANLQAIALSKSPVIASHSAARALRDVSRNLDDELLLAIKKNGGVVQVVGYAYYLRASSAAPERTAALSALNRSARAGGTARIGIGGRAGSIDGCPLATSASGPMAPAGSFSWLDQTSRTTEEKAEIQRQFAEIDRQWPPEPPVSVSDLVDHIDHVVKTIGIDHVGISSDFGGGGGVAAWNDSSETFNVTLELVKRGYSERDIAKIWSGNLLRVWKANEDVARRIQAGRIK